MGKLLGGGGGMQRDNAAEQARIAAENAASAEKAALVAKQAEDADAIKRGLRGRRALLSAAGGELGFQSTLGSSGS